MPDPPVILTHALTRRFGETLAVDRLDLEIYAGEIFGVLGHNGAGKTTTVRLLNGILSPNAGTVQVLGLSPLADGPALRRRTGVLTETPSLDERLTARQNLAIFANLYALPRGEVINRVEACLNTFDLAERGDEKVGGYSKGLKQRLALARALLHNPDILFLDEPTAGLDPVAAREVHELILNLSRQQGHTVFLCTHNLVEAQKLCQRVGVLEHGRLIALGTPADLARQTVHSLRLEIEVPPEQVPKALHTLQSSLGSIPAQAENGLLSVSGVHREQIPDLAAALIAAGVRLYRLDPQEPTLEDVYFALHGST